MEVALASVFPILLSSGSGSLSAEDYVKIYIFSFEGVIWPLEGMPTVMLWFSKFTPVTHTIEAMRCVVSRGK